MTGGFIIEPLGAHDRSAFSCGVAPLDRYLREQASQDVKRLMASCFVAVETATNAIAGYYTLAATSVPATELPPERPETAAALPGLAGGARRSSRGRSALSSQGARQRLACRCRAPRPQGRHKSLRAHCRGEGRKRRRLLSAPRVPALASKPRRCSCRSEPSKRERQNSHGRNAIKDHSKRASPPQGRSWRRRAPRRDAGLALP